MLCGSLSDRDLVERAKSGQREALGKLLDLYQSRLRILVGLKMGPLLRAKEEVEDVLQETYLRAFRSLGGFVWREADSFLSWLVVIADHVIDDFARYHGALKRRCESGGALCHDSDGGFTLEDLISARLTSASKNLRRQERLERLQSAIAQLTEDQRTAIILAKLHELPLREVGRRMSKSEGAVSMHLFRGLRELKRIMKETDSFSLPPHQPGNSGTNGSMDNGRDGPRENVTEPSPRAV